MEVPKKNHTEKGNSKETHSEEGTTEIDTQKTKKKVVKETIDVDEETEEDDGSITENQVIKVVTKKKRKHGNRIPKRKRYDLLYNYFITI